MSLLTSLLTPGNGTFPQGVTVSGDPLIDFPDDSGTDDLVLVRREGHAAQRLALTGKAGSDTNPFFEVNPVSGAVIADATIAGYQLYRLGAGDTANREFFYIESRGDDYGSDFVIGTFASGTGELRRYLFRVAGDEVLRIESNATARFGKRVHGLTSLYLDGTAGNYVTTPDHAALDITGDIDIRIEAALDDWTKATAQGLVSKYLPTGDQRSYLLQITDAASNNRPQIVWSADGTSTLNAAATASVPFADGEVGWLRVTLDVNNGAGGRTATFYTSSDGIEWTQLGDVVTTAGTTSIFNGTAPLWVGARGDDAIHMAGRLFRAQVYNGIDGTLACDLVCDGGPVAPRFRDRTGKTWTFTGSAYAWMSGAR